MLKVKGAICGGMLLLLTGCFPFLQQDTDDISIEDSSDEQDVQIVPRIVTPENYYQSVLQDGVYPHGQSRGFGNAVVYNRLDLEQLELGLTSIAQDQFDPERYVFREGQYITRNELNSWLSRYEEEENELGLNPALGEGETMKDREESQPRYLSHILEHNYLIQNENDQLELGGIVIGLSMNSVYNFRVEDDQGLYYHYEKPIEQAQMLSEGQKIAEKVVARLRSENREEGALQNVPIVVAIFKEQPRESAIPGNFIAKAVAEPEKELERFQDINEQYYLFPSKDATKDVASDAEQFQRFKEEVQSFFDSYLGVVGKGYYVDNQLQELTIEIPLRFQGKAEIVALSQYIADRLSQRFPESLKLNIYVTSVAGKQESIIVRNPNEEPFIHIYD